MLTIKGLDHIVLRVTDLGRMMDFYTRVLGCSLERERPDLGLYHLRAGNAQLDLIPIDGVLGSKGGAAPGVEGRNVDHFCLAIEPYDADAITAWLRQNGAEPSPVAERFGATGLGPSMYVADPEGNVVELKGPSA